MNPYTGTLTELASNEKPAPGRVPVAHTSRAQRHHMNVKPNENCPCGSGRKAKKCCRRARW